MPSQTPIQSQSASHAPGLYGGSAAADEEALLAALRLNDRKAAGEFVARYTDPVYDYVSRRLASNRGQVEDLVQDVFLAAIQSLDKFAGQSSLLGWLLGIARHKVEDFYRAKLREPDPLPDFDDLPPAGLTTQPQFDELIDTTRLHEKARRVLEQLPPEYSAALLWRYWENRSTREMAALTARTEKGMERLLARARARFKQVWEAE
jgi:RNA polymerase sigma-70 factor (ECF subfamily)